MVQTKDSNPSNKQLLKIVGAMITTLVAVSVLHAKYVVPAIIEESRIEWRKDSETTVKAIKSEQTIYLDSLEKRLGIIYDTQRTLDQKLDRIISEVIKTQSNK